MQVKQVSLNMRDKVRVVMVAPRQCGFGRGSRPPPRRADVRIKPDLARLRRHGWSEIDSNGSSLAVGEHGTQASVSFTVAYHLASEVRANYRLLIVDAPLLTHSSCSNALTNLTEWRCNGASVRWELDVVRLDGNQIS
jgi:hypothetical protein